MKILIKNGEVMIKGDGGFEVMWGDVVVNGKRIEKVLNGGYEGDLGEFDKVIDATDKLVMPGLINAHTHAYMSIFRNYADDLEFFDWLHKVEKVEDEMTEEDCYWASLLSIIEMMKTGTTCFVDMCMRSGKAVAGPEGAVSGAVNDSGMRAYIGRGLVEEAETPGAQRRLNEFLADMESYAGNDRVKFILAPHAPYSAPRSLLELVRGVGLERGIPATIHIAESDAEVEGIRRDFGMSPVEYVAETGLFDLPVVAAHLVKATDSDIEILREKGVSVAINPRSNMKLGNGFAPVDKMLAAGVNLCLGTDGDGSNNTQNLFQEMNFASLVYKGNTGRAKCVDAEDVVRFATIGGAKALGMEGLLGVVAEGALADLILIDLTEPEFVPRNNLVSALCYSANGSEVTTMMVNGEVVMEDRKILTFDEEEVYERCNAMAKRLGMEV